jgi:DNA-binding transcriptional ArsR family regulator
MDHWPSLSGTNARGQGAPPRAWNRPDWQVEGVVASLPLSNWLSPVPTRLAIFELLAEQPLPVGELAALLPVSRPAVSQHLKVLKDVGLVVDRSVGTRRLYQVDPSGVAELRAYLDRFWGLALASFKTVVENTGGTP